MLLEVLRPRRSIPLDRSRLDALARAAALLVAVGLLGVGEAGSVRADVSSPPGLLTDRPDFTETSVTIDRHFLQLESGFTFESAGETSRYNLPEGLLRAGIAERVELRFGVPDYERIDVGGATDHRVGEGSLGAKVQLGPDGAQWGAALIPTVSVPLDRYEKARLTPELALAWSRVLPREWSVGGMVGYAWLETAHRGANTLTPTVSFGHPAGERGGTFFEWAATFADGAAAAHLVHHGYTYAVAPDLQIDVHAGVGLSGDAPDFFVGAGVAWRPSSRP